MNISNESAPVADRTAPPLFREVQHFRQLFFWLPVLAVTAIIWWQFAEQVVLGHPQGSRPIPNAAAWVLAIVFGLGFPAVPMVLRLITEVRPGLLMVRLAPLGFRCVPLQEVKSARSREYSAMGEFGGWGIRVSRRGRAYNAYGKTGVQLILADGSFLMIGTQRPEQLLAALRAAGAGVD